MDSVKPNALPEEPSSKQSSTTNEETPLLSSSSRITRSPTASTWSSFSSSKQQTSSQDLERSPPADNVSSQGSNSDDESHDNAPSSRLAILGIIIVLYFGTWLAAVDATMVVAVYNTIGSDFGRFQDSMWILVSYHLGLGPAQPLYGKLSDIFGHRTMLTFAYTLFGIGCILCGLGRDLSQFVCGRVITGIGGAGMTSLVSSLIVHLVPLRDVALWRSWMYVMITFGRSVGAPLGGFLVDTISWRGSFYYQAPLAVLALALVWWKLPTDFEQNTATQGNSSFKPDKGLLPKLRRVDFPGAILLATSIVAFLLFLHTVSKKLTVIDPLVIGLFVLWVMTSLLFQLVEAKYAPEPIFPIRLLLHRDVLTAYLIMGLMVSGQICVSRLQGP